MKRILMSVLTLVICLGVSSSAKAEHDCTKDYQYDRQQSLVKYHYTDESGTKVNKTYGKWSDVPDNLKKMCWECWVDTLGWYNCKEVVGKKAKGDKASSLPAASH